MALGLALTITTTSCTVLPVLSSITLCIHQQKLIYHLILSQINSLKLRKSTTKHFNRLARLIFFVHMFYIIEHFYL